MKTPVLIDKYRGFTAKSLLRAEHRDSRPGQACWTRCLLHKGHHGLPGSGAAASAQCCSRLGHSTLQRAQKCSKRGTKKATKRPLVFSMGAEARMQSVSFCELSWKPACQVTRTFTILGTCVNDHKSTPIFGVTSDSQQVHLRIRIGGFSAEGGGRRWWGGEEPGGEEGALRSR